MITLLSDRDLHTHGYNVEVKEMYIDTDVFYKLFYIINQMGLDKYICFDVDRNGKGVYVRIVSQKGEDKIC